MKGIKDGESSWKKVNENEEWKSKTEGSEGKEKKMKKKKRSEGRIETENRKK